MTEHASAIEETVAPPLMTTRCSYSGVMGFQTSKELWESVQSSFFVFNQRVQARKIALKMTDYLRIMKSHADNPTLAGSSVTFGDLVSQVLTQD